MPRKTFLLLFKVVVCLAIGTMIVFRDNDIIVAICWTINFLLFIGAVFHVFDGFVISDELYAIQKQQSKEKKTIEACFALFNNTASEDEEDQNLGNNIMNQIDLDEIRERASKPIVIPGKGVTCMIPGKYSREYTDYFIGQLSDFFGFDFFYTKKEDIISKLKPNQRLKPYREYLEEDEYTHMQYIEDTAYNEAKHCLDGESSQHRFEDMMFFDSLILNTKRNIDNFGFIVDPIQVDEYGEIPHSFVCFYDEYTSIFDHLNGITFKELDNAEYYYNTYWNEYIRALYSVMSWLDNRLDRICAIDKVSKYVRDRHLLKLKELYYGDNIWFFKDNDQFQLSEIQYIKDLDKEASIFQAHIWSEARALIRSTESRQFWRDMIHNPDEFQKQLQEEKKKLEQKRNEPKTQEELDEEIMSMKRYWFRTMRKDGKIYKKENNV